MGDPARADDREHEGIRAPTDEEREVLTRIKEIRKRAGLTQDEVAGWFGISGASWGRKENGKENRLEAWMLLKLLRATSADARYVFGQPVETDASQRLDRIERLIDTKIPAPAKSDPIYDALSRPEIREIVGLLKQMPDNLLGRVRGYADSLRGNPVVERRKSERPYQGPDKRKVSGSG